jgi:hypothetical protein
MRRVLLACVFVCVLGSLACGDHPALAFYVLKTQELRELRPESGTKLDVGKLSELSLAEGQVQGPCALKLKAGDHQYAIEAKSKEKNFVYSVSMFAQKNKKCVFACSGEVKLPEKFDVHCLKPGWRKEDHAVVWIRVNLKK